MGLYILKFPYRKILLPLAKKLVFVDPDLLSYAATVITLGTGVCYFFALRHPALLLAAILLTFARMTLNTIDGVIALEQKKDTLVGEIVNALPDRYSDLFFLAGIALSPLCGKTLGLLSLASMFLVSYTGMLGKALGVEWQHQGPLGKVERLILVMLFSLGQYLIMLNGLTRLGFWGIQLTLLEWCLLLYIILGQVTVLNRLGGMLAQIRKLEWIKKEKHRAVGKKILVVYDSATGNTQQVAEEIGRCLHADVKKVSAAPSPSRYDLVIVGTPNIRKYPTPKLTAFLKAHGAEMKTYACFVTWGMPVWGPYATRACFKNIAALVGRKPLGVFASKGYHAKYKTYAGHPDNRDLLASFLFGIRLAQRLGVKT